MKSFKLLSLAGLFVLFGMKAALACTCAPPKTPAEELERATAVFSGKVVEIKNQPESKHIFTEVKVILEVEKAWKGIDKSMVTVFTSSHSASCGYSFKKDVSYLVYAYGDPEKSLQTGICSRTRSLKDAKEDLRELDAVSPATCITNTLESSKKNINKRRGDAEPHVGSAIVMQQVVLL